MIASRISTADDAPGSFEALIFDLGGVIVAHDNALRDARLASRCRPTCATDQIRPVVEQPKWMTRQRAAEEIFGELRVRLGYTAVWATFKDDWCCHFRLDAGMLRFVEALARYNRVMLFSNTEQVHWDFDDGLCGGALKRLEAYLSFRLGLAKPEIAAFEAVASKAGIEPSRALFIDDMPANVAAARRAGFQAEVFEGQEKLAAFLMGRGVRFN